MPLSLVIIIIWDIRNVKIISFFCENPIYEISVCNFIFQWNIQIKPGTGISYWDFKSNWISPFSINFIRMRADWVVLFLSLTTVEPGGSQEARWLFYNQSSQVQADPGHSSAVQCHTELGWRSGGLTSPELSQPQSELSAWPVITSRVSSSQSGDIT